MLKTGLEWFKLLVVCLIAILAWQVSRGAEKPEMAPRIKWHLFNTLLNANTGDRSMEQEDYGSNEPADGDDSPIDCVQDATQRLSPPRLGDISLLVSCRTVPPSGELKPALLRGRRR